MTLHFPAGENTAKLNSRILDCFSVPQQTATESSGKHTITHTHTHTHTHSHTHQDYGFLSMRDGARGATYKHLIKNQVQLVAASDSQKQRVMERVRNANCKNVGSLSTCVCACVCVRVCTVCLTLKASQSSLWCKPNKLQCVWLSIGWALCGSAYRPSTGPKDT